ncbi:MAG: hypothetical protein AB7I13_09300 [Vicinamibacterales bacterium]
MALSTVGVAALSLGAAPVAAQGTAPAKKTSKVPRTAWGKPDIGGIWDFRTVTPLERPVELGDKATMTPQEAEEFARKAVEARDADKNRDKEQRRVVNGTAETEDVALAYNNFWWDRGTKVVETMRTSLIIDPPNGRLPEMTPEGKARTAAEDERRERPAWGPEDRSVGERCVLGFNSGPPMTPAAYNMNVQIFQTENTVALLNEMVHNARIVPTDGRPQANVPQWVGTSKGRWEGDTFVVETSGFYQNTSLRGSSPSLKLTERFTRVDEDTLMYEYTVNDPKTWTRPYTVQIPMVKAEGVMYEYACHEGNYGMTSLLSGARFVEKNGGAKPSSK